MGVTGLWKLIESSGKPVPVDTLENKVLAIDISIWLHQVVKGFQDNKGGNLPNAHLLGLFHRLCKLLYYRVKPVFVFDGGVPSLKKETIAKRSHNRGKLQSEADRIQDLILQNLARDKVVRKALGQGVCDALISPSKKPPPKPSKDEIFKLPALPHEESSKYDTSTSTSTSFSTDVSESENSFEEKNLRHSYDINLQAIDPTNELFRSLPADIRHEILTDLKETRKQSSWGRLNELPAGADDFSGFQMKRLLKRRQVQVSLEEAEKQMEGKSLTISELQTLMSEEGILKDPDGVAAKPIASDEHTRFLLVKDLRKATENAQKGIKEEIKTEDVRGDIKEEDVKTEEEDESGKVGTGEKLGHEYDEDLQKAIAMSLEKSQVYKNTDYDEPDEIKLNNKQRKELKSAAAGSSLARAFLLEYGGMNDDDIKNMIEDNEDELNQTRDLHCSFNFQHNDRFILKGEICTPYKDILALKKLTDQPEKCPPNQQNDDVQYISSSSDDSDMEEVIESENVRKNSLEIVFDPSTATCEDENDLFADVFENSDVENIAAAEELPTEVETCMLESNTQTGKLSSQDNLCSSSKSSSINETLSPKPASNGANSILENLKKEMQKVATITLDSISVEEKIDDKSISNEKANILDNLNEKESEITLNITETEKTGESSELETTSVGSDLAQDAELLKNVESSENPCTKSADDVEKVISVQNSSQASSSEQSIAKDNIVNITSPIASKSQSDLEEILSYVQKQTSEVVNIQLDDIRPPETKTFVIDDSDDSDLEIVSNTNKSPIHIANEVIEIPDEISGLKTPKKASSGQSSMDDFFETKFIVKKTPEQAIKKEDSPPPSDITSPFFVNKSGGKKRSSPTAENEPAKKSKISKQLFDDISVEESNERGSGISASGSETDLVPFTEENVFDEAAKLLRQNKTAEELEDIVGDIRNENQALEVERNKQNRMATSITDKMATDCKHLLRLFGIPYIVAPMEAEAQCAFLDAVKLTDGTITDDSDIWLFGGRTVYKNFFNQKKHVLEFKMENIEKLYNMDRQKLIQLAILVGSDYTLGVNGIGAVTAIEILANFPVTPQKDGETTEIMSILSSLRKFRDWWKSSKTAATITGRHALRSKLKNVELMESFPNMNIVQAYLHPTVNNSRDCFTWGEPDIDTICEFAKTKFGWTRNKTDEILQPVIKKLKERKTQASIKNYFAIKSVTNVRDLKVSKRVAKAIDRMSGNYVESPPHKSKERKTRKKVKVAETSESDEVKPKKKPTRKRKAMAADSELEMISEEAPEAIEGTSKAVSRKVGKKTPVIPNPKQPIPQREKDKKEMEMRKEKAAELFKKKKEASK